jgi:phage shock protein C
LRSRRDRVIAGICGGIANYLGVDATLVRVVTIVIALLPGPAVLAYLIAWVLIPEEPNGDPAAPRPPRQPGVGSDNARYIAGGVLIGLGALWLIGAILPGLFDLRVLLPVVLIAIGAALLVQGARR